MASHPTQLSIENILWDAANALRGTLDSSDYKHVVLGMLFLKYLFDENKGAQRGALRLSTAGLSWGDVEQAAESKRPGAAIDTLIGQIESANPALEAAFPRFSLFEGLSPRALRGLASALASVDLAASTSGQGDVLSRTYEYFLSRFAAAEGRLGGEFYTPQSIVRLMVGLLEPFSGVIYDPACGAGGLLVQAKNHAERGGGSLDGIRVVGQESNPMTWRLARLNLTLHGILGELGERWGDTFTEDRHSNLQADFILTNPPFGKGTHWSRDQLIDDPRWVYGVPPANPANFAWIQHYLARLSDNGVAVTVMPNGSLTSRGTEGQIRAAIVDDDRVECVISLPPHLFYSTPIPVSLWILTNNKTARAGRRDRRGEVLFIDARELGRMTSKVHRDLENEDVQSIVRSYHAWQGRAGQAFHPTPGFSASVSIEEIAASAHSLNPTQYVGGVKELSSAAMLRDLPELAVTTLRASVEAEQAGKAARSLLKTVVTDVTGDGAHIGNWAPVRLRDVARLVGGGTPDTRREEYFGGDVAWITPRDLASLAVREIATGARSLSAAGLEASAAKLVPAGAVLVSTRAPIGLVGMASRPLCTNQGIRSIVFHRGSQQDPVFWYYLLRSSTSRLDAAGNGTTFRELRGSSLADLEFDVPPLEVQVAIARYLQIIDRAAATSSALHGSVSGLLEKVAPGLVTGVLHLMT